MMAGYAEVVEALKGKLFQLLREDGVDQMPGEEDSLLASGLLDSLAVVDMASFMESEFGLDFSTLYFDVNQFETIKQMATLVSRHLESAS